MTKEEFTKKFKIGDKIIYSDMDEGDFLKILYFGEERFFFSNEEIGEGSFSYSGDEWSFYIEPRKTVKKWFWIGQNPDYDWILDTELYTEMDARRRFEKFGRGYKKIEVPGLSPIEVEE